jgi:hypothetical protein
VVFSASVESIAKWRELIGKNGKREVDAVEEFAKFFEGRGLAMEMAGQFECAFPQSVCLF